MLLETHGLRVQLISDLHLDHWRQQRHRAHLPIEPQADLLVIAGDVCNGLPQKDDLDWLKSVSDLQEWPHGIFMVLGNHDHYDLELQHAAAAWRQALLGSRIQVLNRDVATIKGVRIAGCTLWTDFARCSPLVMFDANALNDYRHILHEGHLVTVDDILAAHYRDLNWLIDLDAGTADNPLIVVTHHAPTWASLHPLRPTDPLNGAYVSKLEWVMAELNPALWLHGHVHARLACGVLNTRVACNPLGYCGEHVPQGGSLKVNAVTEGSTLRA
jgi:Icc-related predicted phosphoesterase